MRFIFSFLFSIAVLSQCAWEWPNGWDLGAIKPLTINYPGSVATTNTTLTATQSGNIIIFNNSTGVAQNGTMFTLPTATLGLDYTIIADTAKWFYIKPDPADIINFSTATTGQRISNSASAAAGDTIELLCFTVGQWTIRDKTGTFGIGPGQ